MTGELDAAVTPVADALDALGVPYFLTGSVVYACATDFDRAALARRQEDSLLADPGARRFWIATAEDVVLHKLYWFRLGGEVSERQWGDILGVLRVQRSLDGDVLRVWADRLHVGDLLDRAAAEAAR